MNTDIVTVYIQSIEKRIDKQDEILKEFRNQIIRDNILIENKKKNLENLIFNLSKIIY